MTAHTDLDPDHLPEGLRFLAGGGAATRLILARDWRDHPLGPPQGWSGELKVALSTIVNSPESMILAWGRDELFFFFNETYFPLLGPRLPWAMGTPFRDVWADAWAQAKPIIDDAFAGRSQRFNDLPWKLATDRGEADTWFTFSYSRVLDARGDIAGLFVFTNETTARVKADAALRESEKRFRALTNATADVVYIMSPDWQQIRQLNGNGFLKAFRNDGTFWIDDYVPPDDQPFVYAAIEAAIRDKAVFELEHRILRIDGSCGWTLSRAVPMLDDAGEIYEWVGAASDITRRKEDEAARQESERRKDEFLAMLGHELRNPLAPISAAAQLLQVADMDRARVRQTSQIISRQVAHMNGLINDLLDMSRVTRGLVELEERDLDVNRVIADAVEQVTPVIRSRHHRLDLDLAPGAATVHGDDKRLVQIFANLLNNAAKYTPEGGAIRLATEVRAADVVIAVTDNGIGMTADFVGRAFDLFAQAELSSDRAAGGLGIGLALVKSLVELHGGAVGCDSPGIGKGSTFTVRLPRVVAATRDGAPARAPAVEAAAAPLRILVVDDNVDAASTLAMLLDAIGHTVAVEHDARGALARAAAESPQVCILDIGLPDIDGNALARRLRAQDNMRASLLIAATGYGQDDDYAQTRDAGFDAHLVKPIDIERLNALLAGFDDAGFDDAVRAPQ